jgi:hypothetical protein
MRGWLIFDDEHIHVRNRYVQFYVDQKSGKGSKSIEFKKRFVKTTNLNGFLIRIYTIKNQGE